MTEITVTGLDELRRKFHQFPDVFRRALVQTMVATLEAIWGSVPSYPPVATMLKVKRGSKLHSAGSRRVTGQRGMYWASSYRRTYQLGRSLGVDEKGGKISPPDVYTVKEYQASGMMEAEFGTNLEYAPYVIGDYTQAWVHRGRWWTMRKVADRAVPKIRKIFQNMLDELARHFAGGI